MIESEQLREYLKEVYRTYPVNQTGVAQACGMSKQVLNNYAQGRIKDVTTVYKKVAEAYPLGEGVRVRIEQENKSGDNSCYVDSRTLKEYLRSTCRDYKLTSAQVAERIGVSPQMLSNYACGNTAKNVASLYSRVVEAFPAAGASVHQRNVAGNNNCTVGRADDTDTVRHLLEQLAAKDRQIETLQAQISELIALVRRC